MSAPARDPSPESHPIDSDTWSPKWSLSLNGASQFAPAWISQQSRTKHVWLFSFFNVQHRFCTLVYVPVPTLAEQKDARARRPSAPTALRLLLGDFTRSSSACRWPLQLVLSSPWPWRAEEERGHLRNNQTPTSVFASSFLSIIIFTVPTSDLWDLLDGHWLVCLPFFCVCRIVLISGRRSFYSVFSVLPYRDCSQAGYVSSSMPKLVTSSSLCSLFSLPCSLVPLFSVDVLSSDWCLHCFGLFLVDAFSPYGFMLTNNSGFYCILHLCSALILCFSTVASEVLALLVWCRPIFMPSTTICLAV